MRESPWINLPSETTVWGHLWGFRFFSRLWKLHSKCLSAFMNHLCNVFVFVVEPWYAGTRSARSITLPYIWSLANVCAKYCKWCITPEAREEETVNHLLICMSLQKIRGICCSYIQKNWFMCNLLISLSNFCHVHIPVLETQEKFKVKSTGQVIHAKIYVETNASP